MVKLYDTLIGCEVATLPYQTMKVITHLLMWCTPRDAYYVSTTQLRLR